jgi:hypothetical protein
VSSRALDVWHGASATALDEIERAHRAVGGPKPGRRVATLRLTQGYVLLLSAQFQRFCRDLHSESFAWILSQQTMQSGVDTTLLAVLTSGRALDRGNPSPDNILRDFRPICPSFWSDVAQHNGRSLSRRKKLELLNEWRNAIAHHDFTKATASSERVWLKSVQGWRRACNGLAISFDAVVGASLARLVGKAP